MTLARTERYREYNERYADQHKAEKAQYGAARYRRTKDERLAYQRSHYQKNKEAKLKKNKEWCAAHPEFDLWKSAKGRAKKANLPFDIDWRELTIPLVCPVLGIPLKKGNGVLSPNSPSLDRFVPEKGYVRGNVNIISQKANTIKCHATAEEVEKVAAWMRRLTSSRSTAP